MSVVPPQRPAPDALARALVALADAGWTVLHQLRWPGRLHKPVAHVLVGPGGVLVVDVQPWSGVAVDGGVLRVGRKSKARQCHAAQQAGAAVASLLHAEHHDAVRAVVCLPESAARLAPVASGLVLVAASDLRRWALELPARLDDDEVRVIAAHLCWQLGDPSETLDADGADVEAVRADRAAHGVDRAVVVEPVVVEPVVVEPVAVEPGDDASGVHGQPDEASAVDVPLTRRALREAERLADRQRRPGLLGRHRARRERARAAAEPPSRQE